MKISDQGEVTIPRKLREKLGVLPGSQVEFVLEGDQLYLRTLRRSASSNELIARMRGRGSVRMTTDGILALTRGRR
jgi:AbrB family looped-hinge helix DNA binding protein